MSNSRYIHPTLANDLAESVSLYLGKPAQCCLKFEHGLRRETVRGPRVLFTLTDDRKLWVDPPVADKIEATVGAGEAFWILKRKSPGNSQVHIYDVWTGNRDRTQAAAEMVPPEEWENGDLEGKEADAGELAGQPPVSAIRGGASSQPSLNATPKPARTQLEAALVTAVSACHHAQEYGQTLGYPVTFSAEDIRAMAITLVINKQREGK